MHFSRRCLDQLGDRWTASGSEPGDRCTASGSEPVIGRDSVERSALGPPGDSVIIVGDKILHNMIINNY